MFTWKTVPFVESEERRFKHVIFLKYVIFKIRNFTLYKERSMFSMPPSYKYTLKKNGAMFASRESDRKKAYEEFVRAGMGI